MLDSKGKRKAKKNRKILKQLHIYGVFMAQVIASGILMAMILWHFINITTPEVRVMSFSVDGINKTKPKTTSLHYSFTLHNPDLYKRVRYEVLVLRITYKGNPSYKSKHGATINFNPGDAKIEQSPRETRVLSNHTIVNYTVPIMDWAWKDMSDLRTSKTYILLRVVMEVRFMFFNKVIATRQRMRTADLYFDDAANAFIHPGRGLMLT